MPPGAGALSDLQGLVRARRASPRAGGQRPRPHTARLHLTRGELDAGEAWLAQRLGASGALVCFSGGGGRQGMLSRASASRLVSASLSAGRALGEGELAAALAAPGVGAATPASAASRGSPRRSRGALLTARCGSPATARASASRKTLTVRDTSRDTSPVAADDRQRVLEAGGEEPQVARRVCCRCGEPIAASAPVPRRATAASAADRPHHAPGSHSRAGDLAVRRGRRRRGPWQATCRATRRRRRPTFFDGA